MAKHIHLASETNEVIQSIADDGLLGGVYLAKPTGEVLAEDPTYIEVLIGNKSFFAKPCFSFGSWNIPSKKWLDKNKNSILIWIAFENGNSAHAVYLGVQPLDEKVSKMPYLNGKNYTSTKYRYWIDDDKDEFVFERFDDKDNILQKIDINPNGVNIKMGENGVKITKDLVVVGNGKGTEAVIMGNSFLDKLDTILSSIVNDKLVVAGTSATHSPVLVGQAKAFKKTLEATLSNNVKIK